MLRNWILCDILRLTQIGSPIQILRIGYIQTWFWILPSGVIKRGNGESDYINEAL